MIASGCEVGDIWGGQETLIFASQKKQSLHLRLYLRAPSFPLHVCIMLIHVPQSFHLNLATQLKLGQSTECGSYSYNQHRAPFRHEKAYPGGSNKWIYFRNQNVESQLGPDMLSALSLMHQPSGSISSLIKKRTRCGRKAVQAVCCNRGGSSPARRWIFSL